MEAVRIVIDADTSTAEKKINAFTTSINGLSSPLNNAKKSFLATEESSKKLGISTETTEQKVNRYKTTLNSTKTGVDSYKQAMDKAENQTKKYSDAADKAENKTNLLGMGLKKMIGIAAAFVTVGAITNFATDSIAAYKEANVIAQKLEANMQVVKGYAKDPIKIQIAAENIGNTASKIQSKGVYGDDEMLAGASQLSTFQLTDQHITKLMPKMADMVANQKGLNGSAEDFYNNANMIGKAISTGQLAALRKVGITIDENDMKAFKNLNTTERVAMMEKILSENVGNVNEQLRSTPEGKIQALQNSFGDMQERIGEKLIPILGDMAGWFESKIPFIEGLINGVIDVFQKIADEVQAHVMPHVKAFGEWFKEKIPGIKEDLQKLVEKVKDVGKWIVDNKDKILLFGSAIVGAYAGFMTYTAVTNGLTLVTNGLALAQGALNAVMAISPIGWICIAIGAAVAVGILLYKNWDKIKAKTAELWAKFLESPLGSKIKAGFDQVNAAVRKAIGFFLDVKNKVQDLWNKFINSPLGKVTQAFFDLLNPLKTAEALLSKVSGWWKNITSGKKTLEVETKETKTGGGGAKKDGTHFSGLWKVPFDGYMAELHRNEMVLTSGEAEQYRTFVNNQSLDMPEETLGYFNTTKPEPQSQSININKTENSADSNIINLLITVLTKLESKLDKFDKLDLLNLLKELSLGNDELDLDSIAEQYLNSMS